MHASGIGGHSGITTADNKVKTLFAWPNLKQDVQTYVTACTTCQQAKPEHTAALCLLQPLPIPAKAWVIEGLPKSREFDTILDGTTTTAPDLELCLKEKDGINRLIQQKLLRAEQRMNSQADQVYLKLQPYVQTSMAQRSNKKIELQILWALPYFAACWCCRI